MSTTSGTSSTPSQTPSPPHSSGSVSVGPDSYVLPAAISIVAVLLVTVLTAIFVVVICIITRRHTTLKSLNMQHFSSIHYQSTQCDVTFHSSQNAEVPIHDAEAAFDMKHNNGIREAPRNYAALGPFESNNVVQGTTVEPVVEGDSSMPTSQASIHSNKVFYKPTYGMVTWVNPSMLDHPFDSCNWENTMAGTDIRGHYETSPRSQHTGGWYNFQSDCQLTGKGAATDDRHRVLKDAKAQVGTTHQPPLQAPPSALPIVESAHADTLAKVPDKKREPSPISPTYASVDPLSHFPTLAAALTSKHSSCHKPSPSSKSPHVPQKDHIYSEVDKSRKKSANVERDAMAQPQSITLSSTAKGDVPTQEPATCHVYAEVDRSKKKLRRGDAS